MKYKLVYGIIEKEDLHKKVRRNQMEKRSRRRKKQSGFLL